MGWWGTWWWGDEHSRKFKLSEGTNNTTFVFFPNIDVVLNRTFVQPISGMATSK